MRVADQMVGMAEVRNKKTQIIPYATYFMVHELGDLYIKAAEGWVFYAPIRVSSLLEKTADGWQILHQHGSYPDAKTEEGEAFAFDELRAENKKLRDAIKSRTIELEQKNRELEIEAALERVRAVAMSMRTPDDLLSICEVTFNELQHLGFDNLRNAMIHIRNDEQQYLTDYDYSEFTSGEVSKFEYRLHPIFVKYLKQIRSAEDALFEGVLGKDQLDGWKALRKSVGQFDDPRLDEADALYYYLFSIGNGAIGISTFKPVRDAHLDILKRFRNVFNLAYNRYTDITLAEAQARDAQIEAALERVRAKAMGMRKSEEVGAVSDILFAELNKLDLDIRGCSIVVIDEQEDKMELWRARSDVAVKPFESTSLAKAMHILEKYTPDFFPKFLNAVGTRKGCLIEAFSGEGRLQFINAVAEQYNYSKSEKSKLVKNIPEKITTHYIFFKLGYLALLSEKKLSDDDLSIAGRFIEVFDFAYTRFLDIKRAEAQAREAQIEAAVERVRAEAMAMHSTSDFEKVTRQLLQQVKNLALKGFTGATIYLIDESEIFTCYDFSSFGNMTDAKNQFFIYDAKKFPMLGRYPLKEWKKGERYFELDYDCEELQAAAKEIEEINVNVAGALKEALAGGHLTHQWDACGRLSNGFIAFDMVKPPDEDVRNITVKMTHAFEQAYTRFMDLQKAEAQAREAQIEAALERLRAKAMSMHHSDELDEVLAVLCEQFDVLGIVPMSAHLTILDIENNKFTFRETGKFGNRSFGEQTVALDAMDTWKEMVESWKNAEPFSINSLHFPKETLPQVWEVFHESFASMPDDSKITPDDYPDGIYHTAGRHPFGYIGMNQTRKATKEEEEIVAKFANEFGRAYQRFLDLKKAEAQAREAQIEAALERVRSRTMGMQKSEELPEVASLLFQQIQTLGVPVWSTAFNIFSGDKSAVTCHVSSQGQLQPSFIMPLTEEKSFREWYDALESGESFFVQELGGKDLEQHYEYLFTLPGVKDAARPLEEKGISLPTYQINHICSFKHGFLLFITYEKVPDAHPVFRRFTAVFEQTYTRFLDLKNAEEKNVIIQAENERKTRELEEARELQLAMLPKTLPKLPHLDIAVYMQTATEVGGDYYDFSSKADGSLNICLGDATGHGMKAGIMVSSMKSIFTTNSAKMDMPAFFATANSGVKSMGLKRMMMGFAMLNINHHKFQLINAGMPPVFWYRKATGTVDELSQHGMPIGAMQYSQYTVFEQILEKGDALLLLSDGLPELQNKNKEMYGYERIRDDFQAVAEKTPQEIIHYLQKSVARWANGNDLDDDVTFVVLKQK
jgi:hypothetical protein